MGIFIKGVICAVSEDRLCVIFRDAIREWLDTAGSGGVRVAACMDLDGVAAFGLVSVLLMVMVGCTASIDRLCREVAVSPRSLCTAAVDGCLS